MRRSRIEVSIWAWGRGLEIWFVDHVVIDGGPKHAGAWTNLTALLGRTWPTEPIAASRDGAPHASGARLGLAKLAIDTGYEAPSMYARARTGRAMST